MVKVSQKILTLFILSHAATSPVFAAESNNLAPRWVTTGRCDDSIEYVCAVGVASDERTEEDARSRAWTNALTGLARKALPFLESVKEAGQETLQASQWSRVVSLDTDDVDWSGVEEDSTRSSPYVLSSNSNSWKAYVLLRWKRSMVANEAKRLRDAMKLDKSARVVSSLPIGDTSSGTGQLTITTNPSGAVVVVAGYTVGTSNAVLNGIGSGVHDIMIKRVGYVTVEDTLTVRPGQKITKSYRLTKLSKDITLQSEPAEAVIFLNNRVATKRSGNKLKLDYGAVSVRMEKPGYFPETKVINIDEQLDLVTFTLRPMPGFLTVLSDVKNADVAIDGKRVGSSDLINLMLSGGHHTVVVSKPGYEDWTSEVDINGVRGKSLLARPRFLAAGSNSSASSSDETGKSSKKALLSILGGAMVAGAIVTSQSHQDKANRSACDKFTSPTSKAQCLGNADSLDASAAKKNKESQKTALGLGVGAMVSFGFAFGF